MAVIATPRKIKAIPCTYKGRKLRSLLEGRWYAFLELAGYAVIYEGYSYILDDICYRPDFANETLGVWMECKGMPWEDGSDREFRKCGKLALGTQRSVVLLTRPPDPGRNEYEILRYDEGARDAFLENYSFPLEDREYQRCARGALNMKFGRF